MKFEIILNEKDYLYLTMFMESKSGYFKKRKWKMPIILIVVFTFMSASSYVEDKSIFKSLGFLLIGLVLAVIYYFFLRGTFIRNIRKSVEKTYSDRFGKPMLLEFQDHQLLKSSYSGETKIFMEQIAHVFETNVYFLIAFKTGEVLIIPKAQTPLEDFKILLNKLKEQYKFPFEQELNWKFK